jgi:hypothetical protein
MANGNGNIDPVDPPWRLDPLQNIVNVSWGAGVFACGVVQGVSLILLYYKSSAGGWVKGGTILGDFDCRGGACGMVGADPGNNIKGTSVFLLGGGELQVGGGQFLNVAYIMTSTDGGQTWIRSYTNDHSFVTAMVYDPQDQTFYAQATANAGRVNIAEYDWLVLKSSDGVSWVVVETTPATPGVDNNYYSPILIAAADPIYQDGNGNNCAGGIYGYDKSSKTLIAPYPDILSSQYEGRGSGTGIQIREEDTDGNQTTTHATIPGMHQVYSVAFAGGVWQASGRGPGDNGSALVATSKDSGQTWATIYDLDDATAEVVLGGPV